MKNKYIIVLLVIISTFSYSFSTFCKEIGTTEVTMSEKYLDDLKTNKTTSVNDKDVKKLFKVVYEIMSVKAKFGKTTKDINVALDYAVEILQKNPESIEAYLSLAFFSESHIFIDEATRQECIRWLDKNFNDINNPDIETVQKILYLKVLCKGFGGLESFKNYHLLAIKDYILLKIKRECKNKNYSGLAMLEFNYGSCLEEFVNKFPDHVAIPLVKLEILKKYRLNEKYKTCVNEIFKLYEQYKNIELPIGFNFEIECYISLAKVYGKMRDYNNKKKYLLLVKEKDPQRFSWENLENDLESANNILSDPNINIKILDHD